MAKPNSRRKLFLPGESEKRRGEVCRSGLAPPLKSCNIKAIQEQNPNLTRSAPKTGPYFACVAREMKLWHRGSKGEGCM